MAIVKALTKQRQYLLDATEKFEVWMDHKISNTSENYTSSIDNK